MLECKVSSSHLLMVSHNLPNLKHEEKNQPYQDVQYVILLFYWLNEYKCTLYIQFQVQMANLEINIIIKTEGSWMPAITMSFQYGGCGLGD